MEIIFLDMNSPKSRDNRRRKGTERPHTVSGDRENKSGQVFFYFFLLFF
jgi:hypothetical protein